MAGVRLSDFIRESGKSLEALYPAEEAARMALLLCCERLSTKTYTHIVEPSFEIPETSLPALEADLTRLLSGEPLQYVLGVAPFCGRNFRVGPGVLIPRPETEELVSSAEDLLRSMPTEARVLDLCTGSGCIAWTIALDFPTSEVVAVDLSDEALAIAGSQSFSEASSRPLFLKADVLGTIPEMGGFDLIVSNPPYIKDSERALMRKNVLEWEPPMALFVSDDDPLVFYRAVALWALTLLKDSGFCIVEINETLGPETLSVFDDLGFRELQLMKDIFGKDRFVRFRK